MFILYSRKHSSYCNAARDKKKEKLYKGFKITDTIAIRFSFQFIFISINYVFKYIAAIIITT